MSGQSTQYAIGLYRAFPSCFLCGALPEFRAISVSDRNWSGTSLSVRKSFFCFPLPFILFSSKSATSWMNLALNSWVKLAPYFFASSGAIASEIAGLNYRIFFLSLLRPTATVTRKQKALQCPLPSCVKLRRKSRNLAKVLLRTSMSRISTYLQLFVAMVHFFLFVQLF